MTRKDQLFAMNGATLIMLADKLGVKIKCNRTRTSLKEAKQAVIERILAAENASAEQVAPDNQENNPEEEKQEKPAEPSRPEKPEANKEENKPSNALKKSGSSGFFIAAKDGVVVHDRGVQPVFRSPDDAVRATTVIAGQGKAAGIDVMDPVLFQDRGHVGVTVDRGAAVVFHCQISELIQGIADVLSMSVNQEELAVLRFDDCKISSVAAVAVAFHSDDRDVKFVGQSLCIVVVVAGVGDEIDVFQFGPDISNFIEFSVCITND